MTVPAEEFARELGDRAGQMQRSVLEALAEIPGNTGQDIRFLAVSAFREFAKGDKHGRWKAHSLVNYAISAVLHVGPGDWLPDLIKDMDACDPEVVANVRGLMQALKKARRAIEERDDPEPW